MNIKSLNKKYLALIIILLIALVLRIYRIQENFVFHGEIGDNYLQIVRLYESRTIPLLGPPTSHSWLYFGPLYYWIFGPVFILSGFSVFSGAYFFAVMALVLISVNFIFIEKIFNFKIAILSSWLIATSPLFLTLAREARFFSLVTIFFYPFYYCLLKRKYFLSGLFLGIILNFHLSALILFIPLLSDLLFQKSKRSSFVKLVCGLSVLSMPFLWHDVANNFEMTKNLILWIPYRIFGFAGIVNKNNFYIWNFLQNIRHFLMVFDKSLFFEFSLQRSIALILLTCVFMKGVFRQKYKREILLLFSILFYNFLGLIIHGDSPIHYLLPIFVIPTILFSVILAEYSKKHFTALILFVVILINFQHFFGDKWYFMPQDKVWVNKIVPIKLQQQIVEDISNTSKGYPINLIRIGHGDEFEQYYAQNYIFLLWKKGIRVDSSSEISYTINEYEL